MNDKRHAALASTGIYVPETPIDNDALLDRVGRDNAEFYGKIEKSTGIRVRYYAPDSWSTSDLALAAARQALDRARLAPEDLDLIVVGTDTPDYITPSTSVVLQAKLGAKRAGTFDVGCACASFPTAIASASGIIATSPGIDRVLVVGAYLMHRLADPKDPITFFYGDGAGAAIVVRSEEPGFLASAYRADGTYASKWLIASGGTVEPATAAAIDAGRTKVRMVESYPAIINDEGWPVLTRQVVARAELTLDDVDHFVFTQVRKNTIENVMKSLEQPLEKAHTIMQKWGYTGSACIPMALHDAVIEGKIRVGDRIVLVGSGVGFNQAAVAIRITGALAGAR